jgi:hypothetical protein
VYSGIVVTTDSTYNLAIGDANKIIVVNALCTVNLPANASVAYATGPIINIVRQTNSVVTIDGAPGVTSNGASGGAGVISNRYQAATLVKIGTDTWIASGDVSAFA